MNRNTASPLISIIMPVYNAERYLKESLDSILSQTYRNWELIAIEDASTDASLSVLDSYAKKDPRIVIYKNIKNVGVGVSLDKGISLASGDFIARMDADDIAYPERLEKQLKFLQTHPNVVGVGGQVKLIDQRGAYIGEKIFPTTPKGTYEMLYTAVPIQHPTLMVNKSLLPETFTWYDGWKKAQDLYLFFKLVNYGDLANLDDFVLDYRYYTGGNSLKNPKDTFSYTKSIRRLGVARFGYVPTQKDRLVALMQEVVITLLPNKLIPVVYKFVRSLSLFSHLSIKEKIHFVATELHKSHTREGTPAFSH